MVKLLKIWIGTLAMALMWVGNAYSQPIEEKIEILFDLNGYTIEPSIGTNQQSLQTLAGLTNRIERESNLSIISVSVDSYASPDGDSRYNQKLSVSRSESILSYLRDELHIADSLITVRSQGVAWDKLREMVSGSEMEHREEVLDIIDNVEEERWSLIRPTDRWQTLVDSRNKHLMELRGGRPYTYMKEKLFPQLRSGSIVTIFYRRQEEPIISRSIEFAAPQLQMMAMNTATPPQHEISAAEPEEEEEEQKSIRFALKTNLLYDLMLSPNIEVEVPIGKRWSVAGEWICPWWVTKNNGYSLQVLSGQVEGRYWFGDRTNRPQLTGWFAGLYAGGGLYDLQWKNNGYQGEFYIAAGLAGGYAHTINKRGNLRMEYSLGLGYLSTDYRYYEGMQDNEYLVWQHDGKYTWIGPTKAKVSLVWLIDWKRGGKR